MNLKPVPVTIEDETYQAGPRSAAIIRQLLNGSTGDVPFAELIERARVCKLTIDCGEKAEDVQVKVGV